MQFGQVVRNRCDEKGLSRTVTSMEEVLEPLIESLACPLSQEELERRSNQGDARAKLSLGDRLMLGYKVSTGTGTQCRQPIEHST